MQVMLLSEGNTDVTITMHADTQGALRVFVRRILEKEFGRTVTEWEIRGGKLPRLHKRKLGGFQGKVRQAIIDHSINSDISHLGISIDRDGPANKQRLALLCAGRDVAEQEGYRLASSTALGVAVEMIEAWLLADTKALANILGVSGSTSDPESFSDPKAKLNELKKESLLSVNEIYDHLAEQADLDVVMKRCPSFEQFVSEIRQRFTD